MLVIEFMEQNSEISCGVVVIYRHRFLIGKHLSGNHYDFIKGHLEAGETFEACAKREVFEELGLSVDLEEGFYEKTEYEIMGRGHKIVHWFLAFSDGDLKIDFNELKKVKILNFEDAYKRLTYDSAKNLLVKVKEYLDGR